MSCKMREVAMDKVLYEAALKGNKSFLTIVGDEYLLRKNPQNNHIIHIAIRHDRLEFIQEAVKRFPHLISEANCERNNPLHLAAQTGNFTIMELLVHSYKAQAQEQAQAKGDETKPWRAQNEEGNTPLHVALINHNIKVGLFLVEQDGPELACICNNFLETPLHLAIKHGVDDDVKAVETAMKLVWEKLDNYVIDNIPCNLEKSSMCVIEMLLQKERLVACWRDKEGLTPLLRAAKLCPSYLPAIKSIVEHCPESVEVCDASRKTLLHLINKLPNCVDYKELFYSNPQVMALKNHQDMDGNTPTHIALYNKNMDLFLVLLKSGVSLTVTNNEGVSVTDLMIKLKSDHDFWNLYEYEQYKMIESLLSDDKKTGPEAPPNEIIRALETKDIKFLIERIEEDGSSFLHIKYDGDRNILHLLLTNEWQHVLKSTEFTNLVKTILDILPCLICQRDYRGTPLHGFVELAPERVNKPFLEMIKNYFERVKAEATTIEELCYDPPWKTKNEEGDTPLHMILDLPYEAKWIRCARQIIEFDPTLKSEVNGSGENPLHLLSKLHVSYDQLMKDGVLEDVNSMVKDLVAAREMRDVAALTPFDAYRRHLLVDQNKNGDTPLHIAIQNNNFQIAQIFIEILKDVKKLNVLNKCNNDGNTPFHLVAGKSDLPDANKFIQYSLDNYSSQNTHFVGILNQERNTPLHLAILKGDFNFAQILIQSARDTKCLDKILGILNDQNKTPSYLIFSAKYLPYQFRRFIMKNDDVMNAIFVQRIGDFPTEKIKDHINTMGVIATLLATITFTAAFTTPGGLNSANGTPVLMKKTAFKVFMVLDILAMSLSMLVLYSLFWIMNMRSKKYQVVALNLAVDSLLGALNTTTLTFMMGVFVTVYPVSNWIAISTCVLCSILVIVTSTWLTVLPIHPFFITVLTISFLRNMFLRIIKVVKGKAEIMATLISKSAASPLSSREPQNHCIWTSIDCYGQG